MISFPLIKSILTFNILFLFQTIYLYLYQNDKNDDMAKDI